MQNTVITEDQVVTLLETRFVKVYDLQYAPGKHYYDATRHAKADLVAVKTDAQFKKMQPDAVSCFVILQIAGRAPVLLLSWEYRYPAGRYLLSVPAGLLDPEDGDTQDAALKAAAREIREETGLQVKTTDRWSLVNPLVFSTPGMTDESNALACCILSLDSTNELSQSGAEGSELFDGFCLVTKEQARAFLRSGVDEHGNFYSVYTWAALMYFVSDLWME